MESVKNPFFSISDALKEGSNGACEKSFLFSFGCFKVGSF